MTNTKLFTATALLAAALSLVSCGGGKARKAQLEAEAQARADSLAAVEAVQKEQSVMDRIAQLPEEPVFDIITNYGTIRVRLYSGTPLHRANFAKLALGGFFDGILFHRVINGFMIQAGDPLTKNMANKERFGTGGPGYTVPAEFKPEYTHKKGALAAARRGDAANPMKESSGSQFYIVQDAEACAQLDGAYTVFGETVDGLKTVDKIAAVPRDNRDCPIDPVIIQKVVLVNE